MSTNYNSKNISDIYINSKFTKDGIVKIDANYNYSYDITNNSSHVYKFYNNGKKFKEVKLNHNIISNVVNDKFDIQGIHSTKINILIYLVNNNKDNKSIELFDYNTVQVIYNDNIDTLKSDTNKNNISSNLGKIDTNKNKISSNLAKINDNENSISNNLEKVDNFTQYILKSSKDFEQTYIIEKQIFRFNKDKHFYIILEKEIEYDFTKNSLLFVKNNMYYKYENLSNDYYRLQLKYNIYDSENNLIHKYSFNEDTYYNENLDPILHTGEDFCICFKKDYKKIKLNLQLHRHNRHGIGNINLEIDDDNENYINIDYLDKNNEERIDTNKNNISSNLINIKINEDDIAYNLREMNYIKNNIPKSYLKNVYNILFYNKKTQIDFRNLFYEKVFDVNATKNDFIEMNFKIDLQYEDISERNYVKTIYEIFDENDNNLYIKSVTNNNYTYFSNKIFVDENIFYNFTKNVKKIKFVIKFHMISSRVIKIWYIKNDNYRLVIKNYGL